MSLTPHSGTAERNCEKPLTLHPAVRSDARVDGGVKGVKERTLDERVRP